MKAKAVAAGMEDREQEVAESAEDATAARKRPESGGNPAASI